MNGREKKGAGRLGYTPWTHSHGIPKTLPILPGAKEDGKRKKESGEIYKRRKEKGHSKHNKKLERRLAGRSGDELEGKS